MKYSLKLGKYFIFEGTDLKTPAKVGMLVKLLNLTNSKAQKLL